MLRIDPVCGSSCLTRSLLSGLLVLRTWLRSLHRVVTRLPARTRDLAHAGLEPPSRPIRASPAARSACATSLAPGEHSGPRACSGGKLPWGSWQSQCLSDLGQYVYALGPRPVVQGSFVPTTHRPTPNPPIRRAATPTRPRHAGSCGPIAQRATGVSIFAIEMGMREFTQTARIGQC